MRNEVPYGSKGTKADTDGSNNESPVHHGFTVQRIALPDSLHAAFENIKTSSSFGRSRHIIIEKKVDISSNAMLATKNMKNLKGNPIHFIAKPPFPFADKVFEHERLLECTTVKPSCLQRP